MSQNNESAKTLIFSCSGCADVGAIADKAARRLTEQGAGKMFCLAGVGGHVPGIMKMAEAADAILVIDGCPLDCALSCMTEAGLTTSKHMRLGDLGFEKGATAVTDSVVGKVVAEATLWLEGNNAI